MSTTHKTRVEIARHILAERPFKLLVPNLGIRLRTQYIFGRTALAIGCYICVADPLWMEIGQIVDEGYDKRSKEWAYTINIVGRVIDHHQCSGAIRVKASKVSCVFEIVNGKQSR